MDPLGQLCLLSWNVYLGHDHALDHVTGIGLAPLVFCLCLVCAFPLFHDLRRCPKIKLGSSVNYFVCLETQENASPYQNPSPWLGRHLHFWHDDQTARLLGSAKLP